MQTQTHSCTDRDPKTHTLTTLMKKKIVSHKKRRHGHRKGDRQRGVQMWGGAVRSDTHTLREREREGGVPARLWGRVTDKTMSRGT